MNSSVRIDVEQVLRSRVPTLWKYIPKVLVQKLKSIIRQDELNSLLEENDGKTGAEFCRGILRSLQIDVDIINPNFLPDPSHRRVVFVCNHPLGGLDGMALIALLQSHFGGQVWFVVNDLLQAVTPLNSVFLPINKFGKQSKQSLRNIEAAFSGPDPIIIFPAGLVSRLRNIIVDGRKTSVVADLEWHKMFVTRAIQSRRDIVPLYFSGQNSLDFYRKANLRKRLGIGFNLEMILLPREMFLNRGSKFSVVVGDTRPYTQLQAGDPQGVARAIRSEVYLLGKKSTI